MLQACSAALLGLILALQSFSQPVNSTTWFEHLSFTAKSERSWLWGWAWGAESTVSVVDRSPIVSFPSRPAAFGAEIHDPILGYVIPLSSFTSQCPESTNISFSSKPNTGCPRLCLDGPNQPTETWIALVQRGQCEFVNKVREAQRLGARAVVVGGDDPNISGYPDTLVNMYSPEDSSDVKIAATYIKYSDYSQLWYLIESSNTSLSGLKTLSLLITAEYSAWEWYSPIITFIVILLLPSALTFLTLLIHRIRAARAAQRDRAPEDVVHKLPWLVWTGERWEKHDGPTAGSPHSESDPEQGDPTHEQDSSSDASTSHPTVPSLPKQPWFEAQVECAICLSEFAKGDKVRVLPCQHIFHLDEVDEWLIQRKKLCPVCKADVTQPRTSDSSDSHTRSPLPSFDEPHFSRDSRSSSPNVVNERTPLLNYGERHSTRPAPVLMT